MTKPPVREGNREVRFDEKKSELTGHKPVNCEDVLVIIHIVTLSK
jgi:hypothetical protein